MKQVLVSALAVLLAGCSFAQENTTARQPAAADVDGSPEDISEVCILRGEVVTIEGTTIDGATVSVNDTKTATDKDGNWQVHVPAGKKQISISADGYAALSLSISLTNDTDLRFELRPAAVLAVTAEPNHEPADSSAQVYDASDLS